MADKDIHINIRSTADTKGAQATTEALRDTTAAATQLDNASAGLDTNLKKNAASTETFTAGNTRLNAPLRNNSQALLMFSQGFEDAQYGIRGVLNNIPGLIVSLGGTAGLAGAISIAAVGLSVLYEKLGSVETKAETAKEKLEFMKTAVDEIAENKKLELEDEFADAARAIDNAVTRAAALKQEFVETKKAVKELVLAQLELAGENAKAARLDMEIKGKPANMSKADWEKSMDPLRAVEENAKASVEKNREVARQALETDQDRLQKAKETTAEAEKMLEVREKEKTKAQVLLELERDIITALREQKAEKEKVVKDGLKGMAPVTSGDQRDFHEAAKARTKVVDAAKADLSGGSPFSAQLKIAEERIAVLEKALTDNASKLNTDITGAQDAVDDAKTKQTDLSGALVIGAETINTELARKVSEEIGELKKAGLATGDTVTDAAKSAIEAVEREAANQGRGMKPIEQEAVARIQGLINDTIPDSAQGGQLQGLIQGLANNLTAKDAALAGGLQKLIGLVSGQATQYKTLLKSITDLEDKIRQTK